MVCVSGLSASASVSNSVVVCVCTVSSVVTMGSSVVCVASSCSAAVVGLVVVCVSELSASTSTSNSVVVYVCTVSSTVVVASGVDSGFEIETLQNLVSEIFLELFFATDFLLPSHFLVAVACTCCYASTLSIGCL